MEPSKWHRAARHPGPPRLQPADATAAPEDNDAELWSTNAAAAAHTAAPPTAIAPSAAPEAAPAATAG